MNEHAKILVVDDDQRLRDLLLRYLGEQHLRDCVRVVQAAGLALPAPAGA